MGTSIIMHESGHCPAIESEGVRETYSNGWPSGASSREALVVLGQADGRRAPCWSSSRIVIGAIWLYQGSRTAAIWLTVSAGLFVALVAIHEPIKRGGGPCAAGGRFLCEGTGPG